MWLDRYGLEPGVDSGQRDVIQGLVLDAGELVQHFLVESQHHLYIRSSIYHKKRYTYIYMGGVCMSEVSRTYI